MKIEIGKRYRLSSVFMPYQLTVGTLVFLHGEKKWEIIFNDGSIYNAPYEYYNVVCEW